MGLKSFNHEVKCPGCEESSIEAMYGNQNSNMAFLLLMI